MTPAGIAILVNGRIVAWFAEFDESAREWCTANHFGEWLGWRASAPGIIPLTEAEDTEIRRQAAALHKLFQERRLIVGEMISGDDQ